MFKKSIEAIKELERRSIFQRVKRVENEIEGSDETIELEDIDYHGFSVELVDLDHVEKSLNIYGLDSSSRVVDTPYSFIAVGASTVINRFTGFAIDYPDERDIYWEKSGKRFTLLIPELEVSDFDLDMLEGMNVITKNAGGYRYKAGYSKSVALDELRLMLENAVLEEVLFNDFVRNATLLLDGPLYVFPQYLHANMINDMNEFIEAYFKAWISIVSKRLELLKRLYKEKDVIVIGVVKRIDKSNIFSKRDPFKISKGCLNDYTYLSMLVEKTVTPTNTRPVRIGPLTHRPLGVGIELPKRKVYYIGIPKVPYGGSYRSYAFFRVEALDHLDEKEILNPILYDSVLTGTVMPLTILIADDRVKRITNCLVNYIKAVLELPVETTFEYISMS